MNIAFIKNKLNYKDEYLKIMKFCTSSVESNDEIYPKLCHNLADAYIRKNDFQKVLKYSNIGIKSCQENRNFSGLPLLYYQKGFAECKLNKQEFIKSLRISVCLCEAFNKNTLKIIIINKCKKLLNVEI